MNEPAVTLFRHAQILNLDLPSGIGGPADVLVVGDRIASVAPALSAPPQARIIECHGRLLMPGLVNAHFHSTVNHMKGRLPGLPLEIFMLYESPSLPSLMPTPREAYLRTMLGALEMLKSGTTAVQDDAFFLPYPTTDIVDAVVQAYADCGIRASVALDQPEVAELAKLPFLSELLTPALKAELSQPPAFGRTELLGLYDHLISRWHGHDAGRIRAAVSCSAPQRVTPAYFQALNDLSRKHGLAFYAHMLETKLQRVFGEEQLGGRSLVRYVADLGLLSPRMNIIHAIWVDDDDLDLIAGSGAVVAHNPISNLRLGSGVMPFRRMRDRGIPICLGTDEAIADDAVNLWAVMKMTGLIHTISGPDYETWPQAHEILTCATQGGSRAMTMDNTLGRIEAGRLADLILVDTQTLAFTPINDLPRQLVHCESGTSIRLVMVAGRVVVEDGHVTTVDETSLLAEARELFTARAPVLAEAAAAMDRFLPAYQAMYKKAAMRDVGMNRWLGDAVRTRC
jgi:5-methylthioadenosine/S-adenosylhomocysteine deaminase